MSCAVGNDAARDAPKHSAAFILRAAIAAIVPAAGDMQSVHFDKRGAKITIGYDGDDCGGKKDEVEQAANKICADNTAIASLVLSAADKAALEAFAGCAAAGEVGGVTVKKFSANAAKKCIVLEYILGGGSAKKEEAPKGPAKEGKKDVGAAAVKVATPSKYDNVPGITQEMVQSLLAALKAEGVQVDCKEEKLAAKFADIVEVPMTALKNTAYTNGYFANMQNKPVSNFIVKRFP